MPRLHATRTALAWIPPFPLFRERGADNLRISRASLRILAGYAETFAPHGPIGSWQGGEANAAGVTQMPWYEYQPEVDRFVEDMYAAKLV